MQNHQNKSPDGQNLPNKSEKRTRKIEENRDSELWQYLERERERGGAELGSPRSTIGGKRNGRGRGRGFSGCRRRRFIEQKWWARQ